MKNLNEYVQYTANSSTRIHEMTKRAEEIEKELPEVWLKIAELENEIDFYERNHKMSKGENSHTYTVIAGLWLIGIALCIGVKVSLTVLVIAVVVKEFLKVYSNVNEKKAEMKINELNSALQRKREEENSLKNEFEEIMYSIKCENIQMKNVYMAMMGKIS